MSSMLDIVTSALQDIGALGSNINSIRPADTALALRKANQLIGLWNTRQRFKRFERMQSFPVIASKQSYTIGAAANSPAPDFIVTSGNLPAKIDHANWVLSSGSAPHPSYKIQVIEVQQYQDIFLPDFSSPWPYKLYYQKTLPSGTLWPVPFPTELIDSLQLFWWDQLTPVTMANITANLLLPDGYELAFSMTLSELCAPAFGKTISPEFAQMASQARAAIQSLNVTPPRMSTNGNARDEEILGYWP